MTQSAKRALLAFALSSCALPALAQQVDDSAYNVAGTRQLTMPTEQLNPACPNAGGVGVAGVGVVGKTYGGTVCPAPGQTGGSSGSGGVVYGNDAVGSVPSQPPVYDGGFGSDGKIHGLLTDTSGRLSVNVNTLAAGSYIIGKVGIDQTTPGTSNGVQLTGPGVSSGNPLFATLTNPSSSGNAAASATGSAIPGFADFTGFSSGGNLVGVSTANPLPVTLPTTVAVTQATASNLQTTATITNPGFNALQGGAANTAANPFFGSDVVQGPIPGGTAFGSGPTPLAMGGYTGVASGAPSSGTFNAWMVSALGHGSIDLYLGSNQALNVIGGFGNNGASILSADQVATPAQVSPTPVSAQNVFSLVAKASSGNLYGFETVTGSAAGFIVDNNTAAAPATGAATTPIYCVPVAASTSYTWRSDVPLRGTAGHVLLFSTSCGAYNQPSAAPVYLQAEAQ